MAKVKSMVCAAGTVNFLLFICTFDVCILNFYFTKFFILVAAYVAAFAY